MPRKARKDVESLAGQALLKLLLPYLPDDKTLVSISTVSKQCLKDVTEHIPVHLPGLLEKAIIRLQEHWREDFHVGIEWLCSKAGAEAVAHPETAATALQALQDTVGSGQELAPKNAQALQTVLAQQGMMISDELLLSAARLHNNFAADMPRLLFQHSKQKDENGDGLTGLSLEVEAVALGSQCVRTWKQTGWVPRSLPDLLLVACYTSADESDVFEVLLELDRLQVGMLFVTPLPQLSQHAGGPQQQEQQEEGHLDEGQQATLQKAVAEGVELLVELVTASALRGHFTRACRLLALPLAQSIGTEKLFKAMAALMLALKATHIPAATRNTVEQVFAALCQLPSTRDLTSKNIADFLWENAGAARSDTMELCLLYLPGAMEMTPDEILYLLPPVLHGCRLQVVKYLSVLCRSAQLEPKGVYRMMFNFVRECNPTTFPFIVSDLHSFDVSLYLDMEDVMRLLAYSGESRCMVEAVKYFSRMKAAKELPHDSLAEVIEYFVSNRHYCQHNFMCEAANILLRLPGSQHIPQASMQQMLQKALHAGCFPSLRALLTRWPCLKVFFKRLGSEDLIKALQGVFSHSRCAPEELFKAVVKHPNATKIAAADLEPVLKMVCSDQPLGFKDCDNDGCGPATATATQVLKRAPGKPLQKLLQLPCVRNMSTGMLEQLLTVSFQQLGEDEAIWVYQLTAANAADAVKQLPPTMVLAMLDRLLMLQTADSSKALETVLTAPAVQELSADAISQRLQAGIKAGGKDGQLRLLVGLPGTKHWSRQHVAGFIHDAAKKELIHSCVALLKHPQTPDLPAFKVFLADMEVACAQEGQPMMQQPMAKRKRAVCSVLLVAILFSAADRKRREAQSWKAHFGGFS